MAEVAVDESKLGHVIRKVAIVTGGASGIGKALVELLDSKGAIVVFCDINEAAGRELQTKCRHATFFKANVLIWTELSAVFKLTREQYGRVDLIFANAGIIETSNLFEDIHDDDGNLAEPSTAVIDINLKSVILTTKLAWSYFKCNSPPGGSLVMTCSTSGYNERPNLPLYSAAKHGIAGFMRALRHNAAKDNISVSMIAPGGTETGMLDGKARQAFHSLGIPLQKPEYVAMAAVFLATNPEQNGKSLVLIGSRATEVEDKLTEMMPQWYGDYNVWMASKAASVSFQRK